MAAGVRISMVSDEITPKLARLDKKAFSRIRDRLRTWLAPIVEEARGITPDDPDAAHPAHLRKSVSRINPTISPRDFKLTCGIKAGGRLIDIGGRKYNVVALVQHEDLTLHHESGQAKFLERPWLRHIGEALDVIAAAVDAEANV